MTSTDTGPGLESDLVEEGILPLTGARPGIQLGDPLTVPNLTESHGHVEGATGGVLGENARLDRPIAVRARLLDELLQEAFGDALAAMLRCHVKGMLDDAAVRGSARRERRRCPSGHHAIQVVRYEAQLGDFGRKKVRLLRHTGLKGGGSCGNSRGIDLRNGVPGSLEQAAAILTQL